MTSWHNVTAIIAQIVMSSHSHVIQAATMLLLNSSIDRTEVLGV